MYWVRKVEQKNARNQVKIVYRWNNTVMKREEKVFFSFLLNRHVKLCHTNAKRYIYNRHQITFRCAQNCEGWRARKNSLTFDTYESNHAIWRSTRRVKTSGGQRQLLLNESFSGGSFQIQKFRGMGKLPLSSSPGKLSKKKAVLMFEKSVVSEKRKEQGNDKGSSHELCRKALSNPVKCYLP